MTPEVEDVADVFYEVMATVANLAGEKEEGTRIHSELTTQIRTLMLLVRNPEILRKLADHFEQELKDEEEPT